MNQRRGFLHGKPRLWLAPLVVVLIAFIGHLVAVSPSAVAAVLLEVPAGARPTVILIQQQQPRLTEKQAETTFDVPPVGDLQPLPAWIEPKTEPNEEEQDRLESLARYSTGLALEHRGQLAEALRNYQRAWRYCPTARPPAEAAVRLAIVLRRFDEAVRIVLNCPQPKTFSPQELLVLANYLRTQNRFDEAIQVYERLLQDWGDGNEKLRLLASVDLGLLLALQGQSEKAGKYLHELFQLLTSDQLPEFDAERLNRLRSDQAIWIIMAEYLSDVGFFDEARRALDRAAQLNLDRPRYQFYLAVILQREKKADAALAALERAFELGLEAVTDNPFQLLAVILKDLNRSEELIPRLEQYCKQHPKNVPAAYFLALQYFEAGQSEKAKKILRSVPSDKPNLEMCQLLARIYAKEQNWQELFDLCVAVAKRAVLPTVLNHEEFTFADPAVARGIFEVAEKLPAEQLSLQQLMVLVVVAVDSGDWQRAYKYASLLLKREGNKEATTCLAAAAFLLDSEHYQEAYELLKLGVDQGVFTHETPPAYLLLAGAAEMIGKTDEALKIIDQALSAAEDKALLRLRKGWVLYHARRYQQAKEVLSRLLEEKENDFSSPEVREVVRQAKSLLAAVAADTDDFQLAEKLLEEILDEFPDDISAMNDLGYLWADRGVHLQRAYRMTKKAVEAEPDNAAYRDSLGWALYRLGRYEEATAELQKAAQSEEDGVIWDHLGEAYQALGRHEDARKAWQKAEQLFRKEGLTEEADRVAKKLKSLDTRDSHE